MEARLEDYCTNFFFQCTWAWVSAGLRSVGSETENWTLGSGLWTLESLFEVWRERKSVIKRCGNQREKGAEKTRMRSLGRKRCRGFVKLSTPAKQAPRPKPRVLSGAASDSAEGRGRTGRLSGHAQNVDALSEKSLALRSCFPHLYLVRHSCQLVGIVWRRGAAKCECGEKSET